MFSKLYLLALVAPLVAALQVQVPENPTSGGIVTIKWTSQSGDPATFTIELNHPSFNNAIAIANNVQPEQGSIDVPFPIVPAESDYTLTLVNIGNINDVFATSGSFSVGPNGSGATTSSSVSSSSVGSSTRTSSVSRSTVASTTLVTTRPVTSTSAFGTTGSSTPTTPVVGSSGASSAPSVSSTPNSAVTALKVNTNIGAFAAVLFSAVAGAAIIAL